MYEKKSAIGISGSLLLVAGSFDASQKQMKANEIIKLLSAMFNNGAILLKAL